jgi:F0F1-type ATP synthase assembly protein I
MFFWGFVSHELIGIEHKSIKMSTNEAVVIAAMKGGFPESGMFFLPGLDMSKTPTEEEWNAFAAKAKAGPTALVIYNTNGMEVMSAAQLLTEFGSNILAAFVLGIIFTLAPVTFGRGVIISTLIGIGTWLAISASYWNWYRFPLAFTVSELVDQIGGWLLAGVAVAFLLKKRG